MVDTLGQKRYNYTFVSSVPEHLCCLQCKLVARELVYTSCCGESYCKACISYIQQEKQPCPACGEKPFDFLALQKFRLQITGLQVYCDMKERGCEWTGTLSMLDEHLDSDQGTCNYMDIKCPLCSQLVPKNDSERHTTDLCAKRQHVCHHCGFKATYEEVVDVHLPQCKYVPVQCPNFCGVTCEREDLELHMKTCRLEEVVCQFSGVGCEDKFPRENEDEHMEQKSQSHLAKTAAKLVVMNEQLQLEVREQKEKIADLYKNLQEKEEKHKLQEQDWILKLQQYEQSTYNLTMKQKTQEEKNEEQELKLQNQETKILKLDETVLGLKKTLNELLAHKPEMRLSVLEKYASKRSFKMENFSKMRKNRTEYWTSPDMYTHTQAYGYKFQIFIFPNGLHNLTNTAMLIAFYSMRGEYDDQLDWPAKAQVTIELLNFTRGENLKDKKKLVWKRPEEDNTPIKVFHSPAARDERAFVDLHRLDHFVYKDSLYFRVEVVLE